ncbi:MAG: AI-2E family transporter, partial [Gemmatimonadaceae bacterium]
MSTTPPASASARSSMHDRSVSKATEAIGDQGTPDTATIAPLSADGAIAAQVVATPSGEFDEEIESVQPPPPSSRLGSLARMRPTPFIIGLFVLAVLYTIRFAADFLVPLVIAILLNFLLSPLIRRMNRRGIPNAVGAALVGLLVFGSIGVIVTMLAGPASEWMAKAPGSMSAVASRVKRIAQPLAKLQETTARVQDAVSSTAGKKSPEVTVAAPSLLSRMTDRVFSLGMAALTVVFLTFFLLASGDLFMSRVIESIPVFSDKKKAVRIAHDVEDGISRYLMTVASINAGVGLATWGALYFLGMPNA